MRPDKKKTRHHDSQKSKKKALEKAEKASNNNKATPPQKSKRDLPPPQPEPPKITSNWTKLEIPSDDENDYEDEDWGMTGPKFDFVMESADKSHSHFRTKSEKLWEEEHANFTSEFFDLDIERLDKALSCVPLNEILDIDPSEISEKYVLEFKKAAEDRLKSYEETYMAEKRDDEDYMKGLSMGMDEKSMLDKLCTITLDEASSSVTKPPNLKGSPFNHVIDEKKDTQELEEWLDDFLAD